MAGSFNQSKKLKLILVLILILLLVLMVSACNAPVVDPTQPQATEPPQSEEKEIPDSPLPPKDTAVPDTVAPVAPTPSPTASPLPTLTSTPAPYVLVSGNTNCRFGPGSVYDLLHTYLKGDQALLLGKNPDGKFFYISDQSGIIPDCWLWGNYATPVGDTSLIPIFTPPPTPTPNPDFVVSFEKDDCAAGSCWLWFKIINTGSIAWESVLVYAKNMDTSDESINVSNTFKSDIAGSDINKIQVGVSAYTHSERLVNPSGNTVDVIIVACEKDNLTEICQGRQLTVDL
jgi:hypothetical protein